MRYERTTAPTVSVRQYGAVAAARFGAPKPGFDEMIAFLELRFVDPLTFSYLELQWEHGAMLELALKLQDHKPVDRRELAIDPMYDRLAELARGLMQSIAVVYGRPPGALLPEVLSRFERWTRMVTAFHSGFENYALEVELEPADYEPSLTAAKSEFAAFQRAHHRLTPAHLILQTHLEHFVTFAHPVRSVTSLAEAEMLYAPLFALRDEYFDAPRRGALRAYLDRVASIESASAFDRLMEASQLAKAGLRFPELELELEVFA
jgi:hypothetical protein